MALLTDLRKDESGVVYVEFLLAFMPVWVLFLAICQLSLLGTAGAVVRHSAYMAARAAIVVLEDDPEAYDGIERGVVSQGRASSSDLFRLVGALGILGGGAPPPDVGAMLGSAVSGSEGAGPVPQQGARMGPIRTAAYMPLLVLAPDTGRTGEAPKSLVGSLPRDITTTLVSALGYTRAATAVTIHTAAGTEALPKEPIARNANVTVRVSYLYQCSVPIVRALICSTLVSLLAPGDEATPGGRRAAELEARLSMAEAAREPEHALDPNLLYFELRAEVTLPNQGARYEHPEEAR